MENLVLTVGRSELVEPPEKLLCVWGIAVGGFVLGTPAVAGADGSPPSALASSRARVVPFEPNR